MAWHRSDPSAAGRGEVIRVTSSVVELRLVRHWRRSHGEDEQTRVQITRRSERSPDKGGLGAGLSLYRPITVHNVTDYRLDQPNVKQRYPFTS